MTMFSNNSGLFTDHYEMTMAQGYFLENMHNTPAAFDYFFRKNPFHGGYTVFAGLEDLLGALENFRYKDEDLKFLASLGFRDNFLDYLKAFSFKGQIYSVKEGEIVFPGEAVLRVEGGLLECQLVETLVLNILNFESLVATKASRIRLAAGDKLLIDFGLRRAQGPGGIPATRAAIIGGFDMTSNLYSSHEYHLKSTGTMAHSWIQTFDDELRAFRAFAEIYPENCILLVDTYDTLKSGMPNSIIIAREMEEKGHKLRGVRLDSGDLAFLSKKARRMLDDAGLDYVSIVASNQLNEDIIQSLVGENAPIDAFGVGTSVITGQRDAALDGVYKLSMVDGQPSMKVSENITKMTLPGIKEIYRFTDTDNLFYADGIFLEDEAAGGNIHHPIEPVRKTDISGFSREKLLSEVMVNGKSVQELIPPADISSYVKARLKLLPGEFKRFINPHIYKTGISKNLLDLREKLKNEKM